MPVPVTEKMMVSEADDNNNFLEHRQKDATLDVMEASLSELSEDQKKCITFFYLQKKSYHEIADITGFTAMQVKSHIQNGKRNLKIIMEKKLKEKRV